MIVVGAVNVDLVVTAPTLPGPGETVVGPAAERYGGGKGANAAVAAARSGARVHLVGAVGDDELGRGALDELRADGVGTSGVAVHAGATTGTALIVVDARGENQIAVGAGANALVDASAVRDELERRLGSAGCLLVSMEIGQDAVAAAVRAGAAAGVTCVLDPAPVVDVVAELLDLGVLLTPNAGEARAVADAAGLPVADPPDTARALARRTGSPVVVTLGGDGVLVAAPDGSVDAIPPHPATVRDTTGAGDTFTGVLAARLADGAALGAAARTAAVAAALSVSATGARGGMPDAAAIDAATGRR